jgi:hypothetical protein
MTQTPTDALRLVPNMPTVELTDDMLFKIETGETVTWGELKRRQYEQAVRNFNTMREDGSLAAPASPLPGGGDDDWRTCPICLESISAGCETDQLVDRFADALKAKLRAAGEKYGFDDAWKADDWRDKLIEDLLRHIQKGDPRDVAAYCAFAWHHDWSLSPRQDDLRSAAFTDQGAEDRYLSQDERAAGKSVCWVGNGSYEPTEAMIKAGLHYNHRSNPEANMVDSFKNMMMQAGIDGLITYVYKTKLPAAPTGEAK